jgi:hypothetical protein
MIAKKVPMRSLGKSDYGGLVKYLTDKQDKKERIGSVSVTNCQAEEWQFAVTEILNTQAQNTRAMSDKTYHLVVSFPGDEEPDEATLKAIEARICEGLGYGEHQRICVLHRDTDNLHFHIAINKIHPLRHTIHDPYYDHFLLGPLCEKLEREYGLEIVNHQVRKTGSEDRADDMEHHAGVQSLLGWVKRECAGRIKDARSWADLHAILNESGLELREKGNGLVITDGGGLGVKASSVARELSKARLEERLGAFEAATLDPGKSVAVMRAAQARLGKTRGLDGDDELEAVVRAAQKRLEKTLPAAAGSDLDDELEAVVRGVQARLGKKLGLGDDDELEAVVRAAQTRLGKTLPVGRVGGTPPPWSQNRLLGLSQLETMKIGGRRYEAQPLASRVDAVELYARFKQEQRNASAQRSAEWAKAAKRKDSLLESVRQKAQLKRSVIKEFKGRAGKKILYRAIGSVMKEEMQKIHKTYLAERLAIQDRHRQHVWTDWLRLKATEGDQEALAALRGRGAAQGLQGDTVTGQGKARRATPDFAAQDSVTKKGTIIYHVGSTAVRDDGDQLKVSRGADRAGLQNALRLAVVRYGDRIAVNGSADFKERIAQAAATAKLPVSFTDQVLESRRQELLAIRRETNEKRGTVSPGIVRGQTDSRGAGRAGLAAAGVNPTRTGWAGERRFRSFGSASLPDGGFPRKPDVGGIGRRPPPQGQNRLRELSELGVVQLFNGGEVLLPRHVPHHLEQPGAQPDHGVRRDIPGAGTETMTIGQLAADNYIAEREAMRRKVADIPKHIRFNPDNGEAVVFVGVRRIGEESLALLKSGEEIMVLPVDATAARRLKRTVVGDILSVSAKGSIKTKGRSR